MSIDRSNNGGFSLVELIICVSILAIATIPLMKSMGLASRMNAKAQSVQNATSLAERAMEEAKASIGILEEEDAKAIKEGRATHFSSGVYTYEYALKTATQGEEFIASVTINKNTYRGDESLGSDERKNVKSANSLLLPLIESIDTTSQAVLTSKEFNKYDKAAQNYFNQKLAEYDADNPPRIISKTIEIVKSQAPAPYLSAGCTVKATVTYKDGAGNVYVRELYTGSFVPLNKKGSTTEYMDDFSSNIYIFYEKGTINKVAETIKIKDNLMKSGSNKVYFIRQNSSDTVGPTIILNDTDCFVYDKTMAPTPTPDPAFDTTHSFDKTGLTDGDREFTYGESAIQFITNLNTDSTIYNKEARDRVYDITVVLTKSGDTTEYARLNSTVNR